MPDQAGLSQLFTPPPAGLTTPMSYAQGTVLAWDEVTLENTVLIGNTIVTNLPVLGVGEASLITVGSVVGIMAAGDTWAIIGRIVIPDTDEAADALSLLSAKTKFAVATDTVSTTSNTYVELPLANSAPSVDIVVGPSGALLVIWAVQLDIDTGVGRVGADIGGGASPAMSGANTVAASNSHNGFFSLSYGLAGGGTFGYNLTSDHASAYVFTGLNTGLTTVSLQYRAFQSAGETAFFKERALVVIAL